MFRAIVPKGKIVDDGALQAAILAAINDTTKTMVYDFDATVRTWENKPDFYQVDAEVTGGMAQGAAGTDDDIYGYVARGTKPHGEDANSASIMVFASGYTAKTTPGTLGSKAGGVSDEKVYATHVNHPGIQARGFEDAIAKKRQRTLQNNVTAAILKVTGG
jgi:hypothetical protein